MEQQYTFSPNAGNIDPSDLISNTFGSPYYTAQNDGFSGSALFGDDELLDGLQDNSGIPTNSNDFANMNIAFSHPQTIFPNIDQQVHGYPSTPEGDPIRSPYAHSLSRQAFQANIRNMQPDDTNMRNARMPKLSSSARIPMASERPIPSFGPQSMASPVGPEQPSTTNHPIPTPTAPQSANNNNNNNTATTNTWMQPVVGSFGQSFNSGLSSPPPMGRAQINEVMMKAGTSMPAKLGATGQNPQLNPQDLKRKRRRESHNLVERRRRDNINDRIQDLSKLVPTHRLEDDKIRKLIQSGTPLSPTLSGSAGPGGSGRRSGSVVTGLPLEDKDKGPNKGDILNGAVGWMRDLLWMNLTLARQREELENTIREMGGTIPFELSEDESRMHSEIIDIMGKCDLSNFTYSRCTGSGLRVPNFTDYKGDPVTAGGQGNPLSPGLPGTSGAPGGGGTVVFDETPGMWNDLEDGSGSRRNSLSLREEDEYMEFTNS